MKLKFRKLYYIILKVCLKIMKCKSMYVCLSACKCVCGECDRVNVCICVYECTSVQMRQCKCVCVCVCVCVSYACDFSYIRYMFVSPSEKVKKIFKFLFLQTLIIFVVCSFKCIV